MLVKLKTECGEFHFMRRLVIQVIVSIAVAHVQLDYLLGQFPEVCLGEYIVYSFSNYFYFLALFPLLCLAWTSGKGNEVCRYPVLLRYSNRDEFFYIRFLAKASFSLAALAIHMGALLVVGHSLPAASRFTYLFSENLAGIIIRQLLNLFCYVCVLHLLHEILRNIVENTVLDIMLTTIVPMLDLLVNKLLLENVVPWMPWWHVAYILFGRERQEYRFYWLYWLFLIMFLSYLFGELNGRKDYVFEETRKVN